MRVELKELAQLMRCWINLKIWISFESKKDIWDLYDSFVTNASSMVYICTFMSCEAPTCQQSNDGSKFWLKEIQSTRVTLRYKHFDVYY